MPEDEDVAFRFSFEGVQPIDAAFHDTVQLPVGIWEETTGEKLDQADTSEAPPIQEVDLQLSWSKWVEVLMDLHMHANADLKKFSERIVRNLGGGTEAKMIASILCLGIVTGRKEAKIMEIYTRQGLSDLEDSKGNS